MIESGPVASSTCFSLNSNSIFKQLFGYSFYRCVMSVLILDR